MLKSSKNFVVASRNNNDVRENDILMQSSQHSVDLKGTWLHCLVRETRSKLSPRAFTAYGIRQRPQAGKSVLESCRLKLLYCECVHYWRVKPTRTK